MMRTGTYACVIAVAASAVAAVCGVTSLYREFGGSDKPSSTQTLSLGTDATSVSLPSSTAGAPPANPDLADRTRLAEPQLERAEPAASTPAFDGRGTGALPARPERLRLVKIAPTPQADGLPASVDLSPGMPTPGNQGPTRSCVGWAVAYLKHHQEWREAGGRAPDPGKRDGALAFSPAFIYSAINLGRDQGKDLGSDICCALDLAETTGAAPWREMPFNPRNILASASPKATAAAAPYKISGWRRIWTEGNPVHPRVVRAFLAKQHPVIIAAKVDGGFQSVNHRPNYLYDRFEGGKIDLHAMVVVGYDDARQAFRVINSWSTDWGDGGYAWIAYDFFPRSVVEAYIAFDMDNMQAVWPRDEKKSRANERADIRHDPRHETLPDERPEPNTRNTTATAAVEVQTARYGVSYEPRPDLGPGVKFKGTVTVPPGPAGRQAQVFVHFYYDAGGGRAGRMVPATWAGSMFECSGGAAAVASWQVSAGGFNGDWALMTPYAALKLPHGRSDLLAVPVLVIENIAVTTGPPVAFHISK